tara:strand:- start:350 stop:838 length:489 start_codon:yes stop_codon:yes gene_type:complete
MIKSYNLFVTRVTHGKFPIPIELHKKIISFVQKEYVEENNISCVNGFQFHQDFDGKNELDTQLNNYFNNIYNLHIVNSWLNVLGNKSYNFPHSHGGQNVRTSGVFYLSHENNNLHFAKDNDYFKVEPKLFEYLLFPSDLIHYVLPENRNEKRICYAFNLRNL